MTHKAFFTLHRDLPREGPGERGDVSWAADLIGLRRDARICDAGCGPGADIPALLFAAPEAQLNAFDLHLPFVEDARARFSRDPRVTVDQATLLRGAGDSLPDPRDLGVFDLIWCAGAMYFTGVEETLAAWKDALTEDGHIAFSEAVYLTGDPASEVKAQFADYPAMTDIEGVKSRIKASGYDLIGTRILSDAAWEGYFGPMERRIAELRQGADAELTKVLEDSAQEARIWRAHRREFGYLLSVVRPI